ncbi:MAG TPA: hypothetical protein VF618_01820 [Thermoanaerobaculia bacterium]
MGQLVSSHPFINAEAIERFLDQLNAEGWKIGADQYIAASRVMLTLTTSPELLGPGNVVDWLAPVICRSRADQKAFRERFRSMEQGTALAGEHSEGQSRTSAKLKAARRSRGLLAAVAIVCVLGSVALYLIPPGDATEELPVVVDAPEVRPQNQAFSLARDFGPLDDAAIVLLVIGAGIAFFKRRRQHDLSKILARETDLIHHFPQIGTSIFLPTDFRRMTQRLRRRRQMAASTLNVDRTVEVTARSGGFFMPVYAMRGMSPEYLALVDRASVDDQQALLYRAVLDRIRGDDVLVEVYEFHGDPRICWREGREDDRWTLDDLISRHFDRTLLLFGDGDALLHPLTRAPHRWTETLGTSFRAAALLTSRPVAEWDDAEWRLARAGLLVLPSTTAGLTAFVDAQERPENPLSAEMPAAGASSCAIDEDVWLSNFPAEPQHIASLLVGLESRLGEDGMRWLAACAVYPAMHWYLTLYLGAKLKVEDMERKLVELVRLPWFRRGLMPDWLRTELILTLARPDERAIRRHIDELFALAVSEQRGRSPIHLVTFNDLKNAAPDDSPLREYVLVRFMSGRSPKALTVRVREMFEGVRGAMRSVRSRRDSTWRVLAAACVPFLGFFATMGKSASNELRWHAWNALALFLGSFLLLINSVDTAGPLTNVYDGSVLVSFVLTSALAGGVALRGGRLRVPLMSRMADHMAAAEQGAALNRALRLMILINAYWNPVIAVMAAGIRIPDLRWHARAAAGLSLLFWIPIVMESWTGETAAMICRFLLVALVLVGTYVGMRQGPIPLLPRWLTGVFPVQVLPRDPNLRIPFDVYPLLAIAAYVMTCVILLSTEGRGYLFYVLRSEPWLVALTVLLAAIVSSIVGPGNALVIGLLLTIAAVLTGQPSLLPDTASSWIFVAGVGLVLPTLILACRDAAQRKDRNPAPALSALAVTCIASLLVASSYETVLKTIPPVLAGVGGVLLIVTVYLDLSRADVQSNALAPKSVRFGALAALALVAWVGGVVLGMFATVAGNVLASDGFFTGFIALPVMLLTYLASGAQANPFRRIGTTLQLWALLTALSFTHFSLPGSAYFASRRFGDGWEILCVTIALLASVVILLPAGWLQSAALLSPRTRAAGVTAWTALLVSGSMIGAQHRAALELPLPAIVLVALTVIVHYRLLIARTLRSAISLLRFKGGRFPAFRAFRSGVSTPSTVR